MFTYLFTLQLLLARLYPLVDSSWLVCGDGARQRWCVSLTGNTGSLHRPRPRLKPTLLWSWDWESALGRPGFSHPEHRTQETENKNLLTQARFAKAAWSLHWYFSLVNPEGNQAILYLKDQSKQSVKSCSFTNQGVLVQDEMSCSERRYPRCGKARKLKQKHKTRVQPNRECSSGTATLTKTKLRV